ncbi:MAG: hypothetical protein Q9217_000324 [Psora testacea]
MIAQPPEQDVDLTKPRKRSIFNKPAWAKTGSGNVDCGNLFRRSDHTFLNMTAEVDRQTKKKLAKQEEEKFCYGSGGERSSARRRLSDDENEGDSEDEEASDCPEDGKLGRKLVRDTQKASLPHECPHRAKKSLTEQYESAIAKARVAEESRPKVSASTLIDLENEEDNKPVPCERQDEVQVISPGIAQEAVLRDEEFPELARKAREKAQTKRLKQDAFPPPASPRTMLDDEFLQSQYMLQPSLPPLPQEPVLQILITSCIENTQPLIVNRKLSQRLKDVRLAWVERQSFAPNLIETVFLTWRGKRLFDVTSCKSLGISVDVNSRLVYKGEMLGDDEGRIHMEVMTPELLEAYRKAKRDAKIREVRESSDNEEACSPAKESEAQVKIILKAKDFNDLKLIVKPVRYAPDEKYSYS